MKRTQSQIGKFSKRKGASFELAVYKLFNEAFKGSIIFERSPRSGGGSFRGDIIPKTSEENPRDRQPIVEFPFVFELKNREEWTYKALFEGFNSSAIGKYWQQVCEDADSWGKIPILIFTRNYQPNFVLYKQQDLEKYTKPTDSLTNILYCTDGIVVTTLDKFLQELDTKVVIKYVSNHTKNN